MDIEELFAGAACELFKVREQAQRVTDRVQKYVTDADALAAAVKLMHLERGDRVKFISPLTVEVTDGIFMGETYDSDGDLQYLIGCRDSKCKRLDVLRVLPNMIII